MKSFVKYGLWTGIISGLWCLGTFTIIGWLNNIAFHGSIPASQIRSYGGLFSITILVVGIWLGMREVRRQDGGVLAYWQAVKTGIWIAGITAVIVALFSYLYCTVINPGYADFMVRDAERILRSAGKTPQEMAGELEFERKQFTTAAQVMMALAGQAVVGSVASLILGIFTRTKK